MPTPLDTLQSTVLDPATAPADLDQVLAATHAQRAASAAVDLPLEPADTAAVWRARVTAPASADPTQLVLTRRGEQLVGHALVELPAHDNRHVGLVDLHVDLPHRRHGVGRALLDAVAALLREQGRRTLVLEAPADSALAAFARAVGATAEIVDVHRCQPIGEVDRGRVAALRAAAERAAVGYRLEAWTGPVPPHRRTHVALVMHALNDAPTGGLDYGDETWDAERVRSRDRFLAVSGQRLHTVLALAPDAAAAGWTDVAVAQDGTVAWQWGTGVVPAHRGHRLGLLLKTAMVQRLHATEPALRAVHTWNAESNRHMIAVNEQLGYVVLDRGAAWQLAL